uniref:C-type lectin domain-containing protein n=1 Tax=Capitella teleta TaxID=283909 RepID=X2AHF8_CAPTE
MVGANLIPDVTKCKKNRNHSLMLIWHVSKMKLHLFASKLAARMNSLKHCRINEPSWIGTAKTRAALCPTCTTPEGRRDKWRCAGTGTPGSFWKNDQPNSNEYTCAFMDTNGAKGWAVADCDAVMPFVCAKGESAETTASWQKRTPPTTPSPTPSRTSPTTKSTTLSTTSSTTPSTTLSTTPSTFTTPTPPLIPSSPETTTASETTTTAKPTTKAPSTTLSTTSFSTPSTTLSTELPYTIFTLQPESSTTITFESTTMDLAATTAEISTQTQSSEASQQTSDWTSKSTTAEKDTWTDGDLSTLSELSMSTDGAIQSEAASADTRDYDLLIYPIICQVLLIVLVSSTVLATCRNIKTHKESEKEGTADNPFDPPSHHIELEESAAYIVHDPVDELSDHDEIRCEIGVDYINTPTQDGGLEMHENTKDLTEDFNTSDAHYRSQNEYVVHSSPETVSGISLPPQTGYIEPLPSHNGYDVPKPSHNNYDVPKPSHNNYDVPKPSHNNYDVPKPSHNNYDVPKPSHNEHENDVSRFTSNE